MYNVKKEIKKAIIRSQHTQRNWDLNRQIPQEDIETFVHAVTNCPSKQNFAFYNAHFITNREIIDQIHNLSTGLGYLNEKNERIECTNPQTLANLLVVFEEAELSQEYLKKYSLRDNNKIDIQQRDRMFAIGTASGYLNLTAAMLGYQTGCCACFKEIEIRNLLSLKKEIHLIMGVGYKDPNRQRREHHTENVMIPRRIKEKINVKFYV